MWPGYPYNISILTDVFLKGTLHVCMYVCMYVCIACTHTYIHVCKDRTLHLITTAMFPQSKEGKSPLHMAAIHGRFTRSQILIQNGKDLDASCFLPP
jgi:hypothetical protein